MALPDGHLSGLTARIRDQALPEPPLSFGAPAVPDHYLRGVQPRDSHNPATGVGAGAAEVEPLYRRLVAGELRGGTEREELIQRHLALEDVAPDKPEALLEVVGREDLVFDYRVPEVRGVLGDGLYYPVAQSLARAVVPAPLSGLVRDVLHEAGHNVPPLWGEGRVLGGGDHGVDHRPLRDATVLGVVPRPLQVLEGGADHDLGVLRPEILARHRPEVRQLGEREVDLGRGAAAPEGPQLLDKLLRQMLPAHQREERRLGVRTGDDDARLERGPVHQGDAGSS